MPFSSLPRLSGASALALALAGPLAAPAVAQDRGQTYTFYGTPGLLEMPSAISAVDGEIAATIGFFGQQLRTSFTAQVTPRFSATFRYGRITDFFPEGSEDEDLFDRSFDLRYRFTDEGRVMPMIAVGFQDFLGTGIYSGEYVVATKTLTDSVRVTAGLGWGRFGSYNGFTNPLGVISDAFETRPDESTDEGGVPGFKSWFRGDAAVFGGVEWAPTDRLTVKLEYSSDDGYVDSRGEPLFDHASPFNVGLAYRPFPGVRLQAAYLYGSQFALGATISVNPNDRLFGGGLDAPPQPVAVRADAVRAAQSWDRAEVPEADLRDRLRASLRTEGIELLSVELTDRAARVRYNNTRYRTEAQALGRVARILTQELPPSIETLTLEPTRRGIPLSAVTFARTDIEGLENEVGGTAAALDRAALADAGREAGLVVVPPIRDPFSWGLRPYFSFNVFGGDEPVQLGLGAELSAAYRFRPNLVLSTTIRQEILSTGEPNDEVIEDDEVPVVRRNAGLYGQDGHPVIRTLTLAHYGRPAPNLYSRMTLGYLERMYGGVSAELLYKRVEAPWALGLEVNYVGQRDFEQLFSFRDYQVLTGHASLYYDFRNGFHGQIDAGRYLAGDWGATFTLDREFDNGWRVGGFFSLTDIPFADFGEGSFDKGIRLTIPIDFVFGRPTQRSVDSQLRSLNRDGGARLDVDGRLYELVRDGHYGDLEDSWGRFWR